MTTQVYAYPGYDYIADAICGSQGFTKVTAEWSRFPDGESKFRLTDLPVSKTVVLVCSLNQPDQKLSGLYLFSKLLRSYGVEKIILLAPYLCYMRQDKIFNPGEGITAKFCAEFIESFADAIITVDPHLHRIASLDQLYTIPNQTLQAAKAIANHIKHHIEQPVLIGPDSESEQWVREVADGIGCDYTVLEKIRSGDREVKIQMKNASLLDNKNIVLVDDIISTGRTMLETLKLLRPLGFNGAHCVAVHGLFADDSYRQLQAEGALSIVSCDTIPHPSNNINLTALYQDAITQLLQHL